MEPEHQKDLGGPRADAFHGRQLLQDVRVFELVELVERQPVLDDMGGQVAQKHDLRAAEAGGANGSASSRSRRAGRNVIGPNRRAEASEDGVRCFHRELL